MAQETLDIGAGPGPDARIRDGAPARRTAMRRVIGALICLLLAGAAVTSLRAASPGRTGDPRDASPLLPDWPLRGDLTGVIGADLLGGGPEGDEARRLIDANPDARLLFAGRLGGRAVLVAALAPIGQDATIRAVADVRGDDANWRETPLTSSAAGAPAGAGAVAAKASVWALDLPDSTGSDVLTVGPPGPLTVEASVSHMYSVDGSAARDWRRAQATDGVVAIRLPPAVPARLRVRLVTPTATVDLPTTGASMGERSTSIGTDPAIAGMGAVAAMGQRELIRHVDFAVRSMVTALPGSITARVAWTGRSAMSYAVAVMVRGEQSGRPVDAQVWVAWRPPFDIRVNPAPAVGMRVLPTGTTTPQPFMFFGPGEELDSRGRWTYVDPTGRARWLRSGGPGTLPALDSEGTGILTELPARVCRPAPRDCPLLVRTGATGATLHDGPVGELLGTRLP